MNTFPEIIHLKSEVKDLLLGYYDFERFSVILEAHTNSDIIPITLSHEGNHLRLNTNSTFGLLLNKVAKQIKDTKDLPLLSELKDLLQLLLSKCTLVHEMMATYTSLVNYDKEHLVSTLPPEYQKCFNLMKSMVQNVPSTKIWRSSIAWHLARAAMLVKPYRHSVDLTSIDIQEITADLSSVELQSPNYRMKLLHDAMRHFDFDKFQLHLNKFGASEDFILPFLESDDPHQITRAMGLAVSDWRSIDNQFDSCVMYALIDMFDELLPGLEDARQQMSMWRMAKKVYSLVARDNMATSQLTNRQYGLEVRELSLDFCRQQVTFFKPGTTSADILPLEGTFVSHAALSTYKHIRTIFPLYLLHYDEQHDLVETEIHITDFGASGKIPHLVVKGKGEVGLITLVEPMISIIEINAAETIWRQPFFNHIGSMSFYGRAFLHCDMNPILMIEQLLFSGCKIEWCACAVDYQQGPIQLGSELQICIYWIDECPIPIFHFSHTMMTNTLSEFCDEFIGDTTRFMSIEAETVVERLSVQDFSRLLDHPVFMYYLSGTTAQKEVANARKG